MKIKSVLIFSILLYSSICSSQEFKGQVKDSESGKPIQYVNIGVVGKDIGTITGLDGSFSLDLSKAKNKDTLRFSFIGYESLNLVVDYIRKNSLPFEISIKEKAIELKEVVITSNKLTPKVLGILKKDCYPIPLYKKATSNIPFPQLSYRHEIGTFFTNNKALLLDSIQLNFSDIKIDTVSLRVNIYILENDIFTSVLSQPLYIDFHNSNETPRIDVSHLNIQIENDFFVSIENYKRLDDNSLRILANFKSKGREYPTYYRRNTQSNWVNLQSKSQDFGISITACVRQ